MKAINQAPVDLNEVRRGVYESAGELLAAIASPARLRIIQALSNRPHRVDELVERTGEKVGNVSQHLQRLARAGLVRYRKEGTTRIYELTSAEVIRVWLDLQSLANLIDPKISEAEETLCPQELTSELSAGEIMQQVASKKAILVDVRDRAEVDHSPVEKAVAVSIGEILSHKAQFPKAKPIFLLCRGRYCSLANEAVRALRSRGHKVFRLRQSHFELVQAERDVEMSMN